jgi:hypothetical protein
MPPIAISVSSPLAPSNRTQMPESEELLALSDSVSFSHPAKKSALTKRIVVIIVLQKDVCTKNNLRIFAYSLKLQFSAWLVSFKKSLTKWFKVFLNNTSNKTFKLPTTF